MVDALVLLPDLVHSRFKDAALPYQRGILLLGLLVLTVRKLSEWLSTDALKFVFFFVRRSKEEELAPERELLELLLRNAGRVLTRGQLIDRVWGADYVGDTKTLDVHVKRLRSKLEPEPSAPRYIVTVRGLGYKFEP